MWRIKQVAYILCVAVLCIAVFGARSLFAADVTVEVTVDKNRVALGSSVQLNLTFHGRQDIVAPELPEIDGFKTRYVGPSTRMSIVNGRVSSSITHVYSLLPLKVGTFRIPSLSINIEGKTYTTKPVTIEVVQGAAQLPGAGQRQREEDSSSGLEDRIFLILRVDKTKAYVNEIIPVTVKLYINRLAVRDIEYPEIEHEGFLMDDFEKAKQYREVLNGVPHDVIEFKTNIFGTRPGVLQLGPARLECSIITKKRARRSHSWFFDDDFFDSDIFDSFFDRYERYPVNLRSIDVPITIMTLPTTDVPEAFKGALGNFKFFLEASPREVTVGDPITLKMTIVGDGNFKTVNPPVLHSKEGFKVYEPEVSQGTGGKIFEQVIIPTETSVKEIPKISFSFFDTRSGRYKTITKGPIPITVRPVPAGEELKVYEFSEGERGAAARKEILGRDIIYIKESAGRLYRRKDFLFRNPLYALFHFVVLLAVGAVFILQKRRERLATDIRYARRLRAPRGARRNLMATRRLLEGEPHAFFDAVYKTLREYLGDKFHLPSAGITSDVVEELRSRNVDDGILAKIQQCFAQCDTARYAPASITREQMQSTFTLLQELIDSLERAKI